MVLSDNRSFTFFSCDPYCETCYGAAEDNCLSCQEGYMVSYSHRCIVNKTCPAGHFRELGVGDCEPCDDSCESCNGAGDDECVSCREGYVYYDRLCTYHTYRTYNTPTLLTKLENSGWADF